MNEAAEVFAIVWLPLELKHDALGGVPGHANTPWSQPLGL